MVHKLDIVKNGENFAILQRKQGTEKSVTQAEKRDTNVEQAVLYISHTTEHC